MPVELTRNGNAAVLTLNRPEALNALSFQIVREIGAAIDETATSDARVLIVTGAGLDTLPIPSIALINGYAFGGGLELALACTFRLATPNAKVGLPEIKLGLIPGYGGTQRLPRLVGEGRAVEMIMSGRTVGVEEAERIGLIHQVIEGDGMAGALAFAETITGFSLPVLEFAREAVMRSLDNPIGAGLKIEADLNNLAFQTDDATEGMSAFEEKRKAEFKDA